MVSRGITYKTWRLLIVLKYDTAMTMADGMRDFLGIWYT